MTPKLILQCPIASCSRHTPTCIRTPDVGSQARLQSEDASADGNGGVSQRNEYGSVGCVVPVASCGLTPFRRAGIVFGGNRRLGFPGVSKVSPRHRAARLHASRQPSSPPALRLSPLSSLPSSSLPSSRAAVALGRRRCANADARSCRRQCRHRVKPLFRRDGDVGGIWVVEHR